MKNSVARFLLIIVFIQFVIIPQLPSAIANSNGMKKYARLSYQDIVDEPINTNIRVNTPDLKPDSLTQSESSIAVNGKSIVVTFRDRQQGADYAVSTDGGKSFAQHSFPAFPNSLNVADQVVVRGANDGEFYYSTLTFVIVNTERKSIVGVGKSTDNGITFSAPVDASTSLSNLGGFQDKEWIAVDTHANSPFKGNVYVSWSNDRSGANRRIVVARSTDGGQTFLPPVAVSVENEDDLQGAMPAVAPNGDLYVAYRSDLASSKGMEINISIVKSTDGGKTFTSPIVAGRRFLSSPSLTGGLFGVRTDNFPSMAIDQQGIVHIVYGAGVDLGGSAFDKGDIFYTKSTDAGNTFTNAIRLNDDTTSTSQSIPSVAVTDNGIIGVRWWDRRNDPISDSLTDVFMTISRDGGTSFSNNFQVTNHNWFFDPVEKENVGSAEFNFTLSGNYHSDYDGIAAFGNDFFVTWSDERSGDPDVYFTKIPANYNTKTPDFSVSAASTYGSVIAGSNATFPLQLIGRNGFTDNISFTATPQIAGLSYNFTPTPARVSDKAMLTISTTNDVKPDTYLITVTATSRQTIRRTNFRLTVFPTNHPASTPINISKSKNNSHISQDGMKFDNKGNLHVCFVDDNVKFDPQSATLTSGIFYQQLTARGKKFSPSLSIPTVASITRNPRGPALLGLDSKRNIYIAFVADTLDNPASEALFLIKSTDGGKTFSSPVLAFNGSVSSTRTTMVVDARGNIKITVFSFFEGSLGFFVVRSTDQGKTFSQPEMVSPAEAPLRNSAFDSKGTAYFVYAVTEDDGFGPTTVFLSVAPDGKKFTEQREVLKFSDTDSAIINNELLFSGSQLLSIDKDDNIYISFLAFTPPHPPLGEEVTRKDIYFVKSTDKGLTFSQPFNLSQDGQVLRGIDFTSSSSADMAVDRNGRVNVTWLSANGVLVATLLDNGQVGRITNLSGNFGKFRELNTGLADLRFVTDNRKNLHVYWRSAAAAQSEIYLCTIHP
ncbi:MAG: hypothetical protein AB1489_30135 [Acidobacteriota bacterium]